MKTVLVVGRDRKFRTLLRAQLREGNCNALGFESLEEAADAVVNSPDPVAALVFDTTEAPAKESEALVSALATRLPVVVVAAAHETFDLAQDGAASHGPVTVLRRPVQLGEVVAALEKLMEAAR